jgi:hypothetical protein
VVDTCPAFSIIDTVTCAIIDLNDLVYNLSANSVIAFYSDSLQNLPLTETKVHILSDTVFYARATDTLSGCASVKSVLVHRGIYPPNTPITGSKTVCIGDTITLTNAEDGVWSISDPLFGEGELVDPVNHSVKVRGVSEGKVFVSYTIGTGNCQTRTTFGLTVIPLSPPNIIIGIERP